MKMKPDSETVKTAEAIPLMADELQEVEVCSALMEASLNPIMRDRPTSHVVLGLADILSRILRAQTDPKRGLEIFTRIVQERLALSSEEVGRES